MTGTVELAPDGAYLLIRFPYREDLVAVVRDLPGRRWDPKGKQWRVPCAQVELVYALLAGHLFEFAPEVSSLLAGTLGSQPLPPARDAVQTKLPRDAAAAAVGEDVDALTVSALNDMVRGALRATFPQAVWVVGEIVDFDKQGASKHRFFSLVERAEGETRPRAIVEVVLFERTAEALLPRLQNAAEPLTLQDGIEIRALVRLDLYPASGRFQLVIDDIDPSFTLGKMALGREQILRELRQKGLIERNRALPLPVPPLRVGVLTSPDSDGWNDLLRHLQDAAIGFDITLVPIRVQGIELKPSMLAGLRWFADHADAFDVLCIVRGGGSRSDLAWFDDRDIAHAVALHPLKILVGIGHQRDESVLDVIAHAEKTPTAVAAHLVRCVETARQLLAEQDRQLRGSVDRLVATLRARLCSHARDLRDRVAERMSREHAFLGQTIRSLTLGSLRRVRDGQQQCKALAHDLGGATRLCLHQGGSRLATMDARLQHATQRALDRAHNRLEQQASRQRLLDPMVILARGFALVRGEDGKIIPSADRLQRDQNLILRMRDGSVRAKTTQVDLDV